MIKIYRSENGILIPAERIEKHSWVLLLNPSLDEINYIEKKLKIFSEFLRYPLDEEERPRVEKEEGQVLIIIRIPMPTTTGLYNKYETIPVGIILTDEYVLTLCLTEHPIFEDFIQFANKAKSFDLSKPVSFLLHFMLLGTTLYIRYLRHIDRIIETYEEAIFRALANEEILHMLSIEKTLTLVLSKLLSGRFIRLTDDDIELLNDVQIENKQALEMTKVFTSTLANTMDAYASIVNNNVNVIMKFLASMAIIISIPNLIYSMYGMNIPLPLQELPPLEKTPHAFYIVNAIILAICIVLFFIFRKKKYI
jgi:magnesium transporter